VIQPTDIVGIVLLVLLEGLLSADNAMALATLLAAYLIRVTWVKLVGGGYLLYLAAHHFTQHRTSETRRTPAQATPVLGLTAFWATVVKVEFTTSCSPSTPSSLRSQCRRSCG
jgi:threonine/homoserine/homoserine lactone efflux protein